ncbi:MAG: flippase-like domain-containing protein [Myxococcales bacterium]|nr:flippase-like domain-containing protein [Myxococcales bacterium]
MNPRRALPALQALLTVAVFAYLLTLVDTGALAATFARAPLWGIPLASVILLCVMAIGALRWSLLIGAYGGQHVPFARLLRLQLVGLFYNMLPGAVGGDVVRGLVSRDAFGPGGALSGVAVVFVERVVGLLGLLALVSTMLLIHRLPALDSMLDRRVLWLGLLTVAAAIAALALARRLAAYLPGRLGELLSALPALSHPGRFALAALVSISNQALVAVLAHCLMAPLAPEVTLLDSMVLAPVAFAAVFFPLTVAGAGTRDAAMVLLYGSLGVSRAVALSASLQVLLTYLVVAAIGGLLALLRPLR